MILSNNFFFKTNICLGTIFAIFLIMEDVCGAKTCTACAQVADAAMDTDTLPTPMDLDADLVLLYVDLLLELDRLNGLLRCDKTKTKF